MDALKIKRTPVESSNIKSIGHHKDGKTLVIEFKKGGIYSYYPVMLETFNEFMAAESKGRYFDKNIKHNATLNMQKLQK